MLIRTRSRFEASEYPHSTDRFAKYVPPPALGSIRKPLRPSSLPKSLRAQQGQKLQRLLAKSRTLRDQVLAEKMERESGSMPPKQESFKDGQQLLHASGVDQEGDAVAEGVRVACEALAQMVVQGVHLKKDDIEPLLNVLQETDKRCNRLLRRFVTNSDRRGRLAFLRLGLTQSRACLWAVDTRAMLPKGPGP